MILRLSFSNFLSVLDGQELSMIAGKRKVPSEAHRLAFGGHKVVPAAVIYGPNAAGKSNLVKAIEFIRNAVMYSHSRRDPGGSIQHYPFKFQSDSKSTSSVLELDFVVDGVRYQFGFESNDKMYLSEWLFSFPEGKRRKIYERDSGRVSFGPSMRGQKKVLADFMRPNSLFLSTATQNGHEYLSKITSFFESIEIEDSIYTSSADVNIYFSDNELDGRVIDKLNDFGTGINGHKKVARKLSEKSANFRKRIFEIFSDVYQDMDDSFRLDEENSYEIQFSHQSAFDEDCYLDIWYESAGTRRLAVLLSKVFKALDEGSLIVIDEIDASLHTYVVAKIVSLFDDKNINNKGAQLIATTHDTNIMSFVQHDQIWLAEKNFKGATEIFSVLDFKIRPNDDIERIYLSGRLGASICGPI